MLLDDLIQRMRGFQEPRVLLGAVELDIFSAVGGGATAARVAARAGTDARATGMLLNALVALGALTKKRTVYRNTPASARLVGGQRLALMHTVNVFKAWTTLTDCVRKGTAVVPPKVERRNPEWTRSFIAAMHANAATAAAEMVRRVGAKHVRRLLDIGGGSGAYSLAFARANKSLRAEVFDLDSVVPIAQQHIDEAGLGDRVTTRTGNLRRDEFGSGYDLVLLSAICHMLGPEENLDLLCRSFRALAPGGRVVIRDFILDEDKTSPARAALFALNMLVATEKGATYTEAEYASWLRQAGFRNVTRPDPAGDLIIGCRPRLSTSG